MQTARNEASDRSDHGLTEAFAQAGDSVAFELFKTEERRRMSEQALAQAATSHKIAMASLAIACFSLVVACIAVLEGS